MGLVLFGLLATGAAAPVRSQAVAAPEFELSPGGALARAAVPGWGQWYNGRELKAVLFAAGRIYLGARAVYEHNLATELAAEARQYLGPTASSAEAARNELLRDAKWRERNQALDRRDDFIWWSVFALVFSMLEAYVDAALINVESEFDELKEEEVLTARIGYRHRF